MGNSVLEIPWVVNEISSNVRKTKYYKNAPDASTNLFMIYQVCHVKGIQASTRLLHLCILALPPVKCTQ